jgi:hypothetical protein
MVTVSLITDSVTSERAFKSLDSFSSFCQVDWVYFLIYVATINGSDPLSPINSSTIQPINFRKGGIKMKKTITITMLLMLVVAISCANMSGGEKGALTGAGVGAAGGAAITAIFGGNAAVGAAVGGAAGAVAGGLIGGSKDKKDTEDKEVKTE